MCIRIYEVAVNENYEFQILKILFTQVENITECIDMRPVYISIGNYNCGNFHDTLRS